MLLVLLWFVFVCDDGIWLSLAELVWGQFVTTITKK